MNISLEDMKNGQGHWKNIQNIVRTTFCTVFNEIQENKNMIKHQNDHIEELKDTIKYQNDEITSLKNTIKNEIDSSINDIRKTLETKASNLKMLNLLESKASKTELKEAMADKTHYQELHRTFSKQQNEQKRELLDFVQKVENRVKEKPSQNEITALVNPLASKQEVNEISQMFGLKADEVKQAIKDTNQELMQLIDLKANTSEIEDKLSNKVSKANFSSALKKKANKDDIPHKEIEKKVDYSEFQEQLSNKLEESQIISMIDTEKGSIKKDMNKEVENLRNRIENLQESLTNYAYSNDLIPLRSSLEDHKNKFKKLWSNIDTHKKDIQNVEVQIDNLLKEELKSLKEEISAKTDFSQVKDALTYKVNVADFDKKMEELSKRNSDLSEDHHKQIESLQDILYAKCDQIEEQISQDRECIAHRMKKKLSTKDFKKYCEKYAKVDEIRKELLLKADAKDMCQLVDNKEETIQKEIDSLKKSLENKASTSQVNKTLEDIAVINDAFMKHHCIGRWIWKSGQLKNGHGVPWNIQVINADPNNYLWEKDRVTIIVIQPGLYEICFGFYSRKKPTIQLHIGGEPVLSLHDNSPSLVRHQLSNATRKKAGNITGLTAVEYLALPERSRLAISYSGEENSEGFLNLRKL